MQTVIKTFIVKSRGRKYFSCTLSGYKAKLLINEVSTGLDIDQEVRLEVVDLSEHTKYGSNLIFQPVNIVTDDDIDAMKKDASRRKETEKWLSYAEDDVKYGKYKTNAILKAQFLCKNYDDLSERMEALIGAVKVNELADQERKNRVTDQVKSRVLFPLAALPEMGRPVRWKNSVLIFESTGKAFMIDEGHPSIAGSHLLGYEGEYGCYCYYREATNEEAETIN